MGKKETEAGNQAVLELSRRGAVMFRNNVGLAHYPDGARVRYGLIKGSSDWIGWLPVTVTPEMVGRRVAVFVACETKAPSAAGARANQRNFIAQVLDGGGLGFVARGAACVVSAVEGFLAQLNGEGKV